MRRGKLATINENRGKSESGDTHGNRGTGANRGKIGQNKGHPHIST